MEEKETIYVVEEDNHGEIGYAKTLKGVAEILVNGGWITPQTTIYDGRKENPITDYVNEVTVESIQKALEEDNEMFTDWIYVKTEILHE